MKIALLGKGKTGSKVAQLAQSEVTVIDSKSNISVDELKNYDVIISFLPGDAFLSLIPILLETSLPVVTGSTGHAWPEGFDSLLKEKNLRWIYASNFSLGMVVVKHMLLKMNQMESLFQEKVIGLHEIHHTQKRDAPSGTALSMKSWLGLPCPITSERTGDVVGIHSLTFETPGEIIRLEHTAKDRRVFAEGALWASRFILNQNIAPGLHEFSSVVKTHFNL